MGLLKAVEQELSLIYGSEYPPELPSELPPDATMFDLPPIMDSAELPERPKADGLPVKLEPFIEMAFIPV